MIPDFLDKFQIPQKSGVYIFKDIKGETLYIGKAVNLYHRVASYFNRSVDEKTRLLAEKIALLETVVVESELEALILETNLIKKYLPPFNIRLTDDKDYLYIGVTREEFPKVITLRKQDLKRVNKFWGPFPSSRTVKNTLKMLRRIFPWCDSIGRRPCFYYHLGLCSGPCAGVISKKDYQKIINQFAKFMDGKKDELILELYQEMEKASCELDFERALKIKKIISGITYITQTNRVQLYLENPNFLEEERKLSLISLKKDLNLKNIPQRIECYDISNIFGKEAVGSMVVLTGGEIDKSQYRKFKIRISGKINDVAMHREMLSRRLKHKEWPLPDLIIVDGGRGQARGIKLELGGWRLEIPIFGLAKKREWLYPPEGEIIKLPRKSLSLKLLQRLRDESHRFAVSYHRKLHRKSVFNIV